MAEVEIKSLGKKGDGVAVLDNDEIFVPFTLAGERVRVSGSGKRREIATILSPSDDRIDPVCEHFGECGGCQLQHMSDEAYREWKRQLVVDPLSQAGIACEVDPLICFSDAGRRKAVFSACRIDGDLKLGYAKRSSNEIINVSKCPIAVDEVEAKLPEIREVISTLPLGKTPIHVMAMAAENGLDLAIDGALRLSVPQQQAFARKSIELGFLRASFNGEVLLESERPELIMGSAKVTPAPGAFVQAVGEAEIAMAELVTMHLTKCKRVADLYCGIGTFALRLATHATVLAFEDYAPAVEALNRAWRETGGKLKQITAETRNLDRRPLSFQEMKKLDGVVFDPPRAGAEAQARQLAKSKVGGIAAVSCNPVTLGRDLAILVEGGYRVTKVVPIDQFRFTPHVEVVALLER